MDIFIHSSWVGWFSRYCQIVFQDDHSNLHCCQHGINIPTEPPLYKELCIVGVLGNKKAGKREMERLFRGAEAVHIEIELSW